MKFNILGYIWVVVLWLQPGWANGQATPVFVTDYEGVLYAVNVPGCTIRSFGAIPPMADIAFTPDGRLWGITPDTAGGRLYLIDTVNVEAVYKGHTAIYGNSLVALNDSILLMVYGRDLYGIRVRDASTYRIGDIRYPSMGDLAWYGRDLYLASADTLLVFNGLLVKIELNKTFDTVVSAIALNDPYKPIPSCFGLATITLPATGPSLVGFSRYGAYKINTEDASYQLLCDSLPVSLGVSGAAYMSPSLGGTAIAADPEKPRLRLYPNPAHGRVQLQLDNFSGAPGALVLYLYDYTGRLIMRRDIASSRETIDLGGYSPGLYIIRLEYKGNTIAVEKLERA
ncbi:T9SS type A sorting domain-containing protein [Taibaiella chishuiensis]|uniref:Putative secreted protein (Por secretion system target) n=1 Tax=Taibaiella chishuiensis TaxID=1434707 RepID=A0A2P8CZB5_9BACT|nr:T9SS type A sorting domain-containing protein [Taibaiella chishuiensis]PSK90277.1 putative secreted protein (Por secretion system target) [Taibaiella chishuiensis]